MIKGITAAGVVWAGSAAAACETVFIGCTFDTGVKAVTVCVTDDEATYEFGPTGDVPDLTLAEPVSTVAYTPWPGVGRAIWETVTFQNGAYRYEVYAGIDRNPDGEPPYGGVIVRKGDQELTDLTCDLGSVTYTYDPVLSDAKAAAGLCWSGDAEAGWQGC